MTTFHHRLQALMAAVILPFSTLAVAFEAGDDCVSPYVIADGDSASLRAAFLCANADGTDSRIELAAGGDYPFVDDDSGTNKRALPGISDDGLFELLGHGAMLRRDGAASENFGLMQVDAAATARLQDLVLSGGVFDTSGGGGALRVAGAATASGLRVLANQAILNGGGIYVTGTLHLVDSAVEGNSASSGGGIKVDPAGSLWMDRSTVTGNEATGSGGGGGVEAVGVVRILNTRITGNSASGGTGRGGGVRANDFTSDVTIVNSTIFDNTSPLDGEQVRHASGTMRIYNSLLGESVVDAVADCSNVTSANETFVTDGTCSATLSGTVGFLPEATGSNGTGFLALDGSNTAVIGAASAGWLDEAIVGVDLNGDGDLVDDLGGDTDQSGKPRVVGDDPEMGAVEYVCGDLGVHVPVSVDELVAAIVCANNDGVDSTVELVSDSYPLLEADNSDGDGLGNALPAFVDDGNLTINGHGGIIERSADAAEDFRLMFVDTTNNVAILNDLVLQGGVVSGFGRSGGAILSEGPLQLHRSVVRNNMVLGEEASGGGIASRGQLLLSQSLLTGNLVLGQMGSGGGLDQRFGPHDAVIVNSTFSANLVVDGIGAGIHASGADLTIVNSTVAGNSAIGATEVAVVSSTVRAYNNIVASDSGTACSGSGMFLDYVIANSLASDPSCGAQYVGDPQLLPLDADAPVPYRAIGGGNVDAVDTGDSQWLDETVVSRDLNGDGDQLDDLSGGIDQAGDARVRCAEVDLGAVEYVDCDASYRVGGTVSGLAAGNSVTVSLNSTASLEVSGNGAFAFPPPLAYGSTYQVEVSGQPMAPNQTCTVDNGDGRVANADVGDVLVSCVTNQYSIGGTVSGLAAGNSVVLRNNGGDDLSVGANGGFTFSTPLDDGAGYAVTVSTQPTAPNQTCTVADGSGDLAGADVTDVAISCVFDQYSVGGSVSGLADGNVLVLRNNGGDELQVDANGGFTFDTPIDDGAEYLVTATLLTAPTSQRCQVDNGSGEVAGAAVSDVLVTCEDDGVDLVVTITDGADAVQAGALLSYMIEVANRGPLGVEGALVQSTIDGALVDVEWACMAGAGAACPAAGTGDIDAQVDLAADASVAFVLTAQVPAGFLGTLESSVHAFVPPDRTELQPEDNSAIDISRTDRVFGDGFETPESNLKTWLLSVAD